MQKTTIFKRFVAFVLVICLLTASTFATPTAVTEKVGELSQDIRFAFLSSKLATQFPVWLASFFSTGNVETKNETMSRLKIFPGDVTVQQGEKLVFSAVAFDEKDAPVGGVGFEWEIADTGRGLRARPLKNGQFEASVVGTFTITARGGGQEAQAVVTVNPSAAGTPAQEGFQAETPKYISTSSDGKETVTDSKIETKDGEVKEGQQTESQNLLPGEGWDDGNWGSSDDPGNLPGTAPGHAADDGAGNGNFQLTAPVISLPGRGTDLNLNLTYNSRLWNKSGSQLTYDIDRGFPAPGWSLGFGKMMDMGANGGSMLVDADGTRHSYSGIVQPGWNGYSTFQGHTTNGKFIDYTSYRDSAGVYSATAYLPNGTVIQYGAKGDGAVHPTYIRDVQGNYITVTYRNNQGPAIQTITDTMGRVITFNYDSSTPARLLSVTAPRMQNEDPAYGTGATRTLLKLHYRSLTLSHSFAAGNTAMVRTNPVNVIDSIYYPANNTGYWFGGANTSHPDYASYYSSYGMITKIEEQRGMSWTTGSEEQGTILPGTMSKRSVYNYPLTTANESGRTNGIGLSDAPTYTTLTESYDGMDDTAAVTTYAINNNDYHWDGTSNSPSRTVTVTHPNGVINKQYSYRTPTWWMDGLVFADETIVNDVTQGGTTPRVVSSSLISWQQGDYNSPRPTWAESYDENNKKVKTYYDYSNGLFNQVTRSCDYDNAGALLKCSNAVYENSIPYKGYWYSVNTQSGTVWYFAGGRHVFNSLTYTDVENPDGTKASRTVHELDNYSAQPMVSTPGVIQHESTHDPYTTETTTVQGECMQWEEHPYGGQYCVWWNYYEVSVYDATTDKRGNVTKVTVYSDAAAQTGALSETKTYDINGNLRIDSSHASEQTSVQYSIATQYAYPESQTQGSPDPNSPHRITMSSVYDVNSGVIKQKTDANGRTSTTMYNPDTIRPVKSTSSTGSYTVWAYDETAMSVTEEVKEATGDTASKNIKYLNGAGLLKREEVLGAGGVWDIVESKYNKLGQVWKESRPFRTGDTVQWRENVYDNQSRTIKVIEPDGSYSQAFYNEATRPDSASTAIGQTIRYVDAWGRERWERYDQQRRLAEVVEPNPNGNGSVFAAGSLMTKYTQDTLGRLTKTEQGSQIREFKYDSLGRLLRQKLAEQTATLDDNGTYVGAGNGAAKWGEAFFYDARSNLTSKTDARGAKTHYSYLINGVEDPLNRVQWKIFDLTGPLEPNLTIHAAPNVSYTYMSTGDKTRISQTRTHGILTEDFVYDAEGRVQDYTQTVDVRTSYPMTTSYLYDTLDRVKEIRYPAQYGLAGNPRRIVQKSYDVASRVSDMTVNGNSAATNIVYNAADQTTSLKIGNSGRDQLTENYYYDEQTGLLTSQTVKKNNLTHLLSLSYDYSRNNSTGTLNGKTGHLTKVINNLDNSKNREYEFDAVGRLTKAKGGNNLSQQLYTYDRYGNRQTVTATGVAADGTAIPSDGIANLAYNASNNRITTAGFEYDVNGNQTRALAEDGTWIRYQYDSANRLQIITRDDGTYLQAYQFGSGNVRLMDMDYVYGYLKIFATNGDSTLSEYTEFTGQVPTWTKSYTYLAGNALSTVTPDGLGGESTEYNHPDRLGTRMITNKAATYEQVTLPFGTALNAESTVTNNPNRFTSYQRSARTGLDYAINRTYDSKQGRFTQVDPIAMAAVDFSNPQTLNLYSYCGNDPINHVDPDGLFFGSLFKAIGKLFKKAFKWIAVALAVAVAVLTIIYAPVLFTSSLKLVFGVIAAVAGAASTVLNAFGLTKAAAIFGIIGAIASLGTSILALKSALNWKTILGAISAGANAASRVLSEFGYKKLGQIFGLISTVTGFIADGLKEVKDKNGVTTLKWDSSIWRIYKFARSSAEQIANIAGATKTAGFLNAFGIVDDIGDYANLVNRLKKSQGKILYPPDDVKKLDFWKNTVRSLSGKELTDAQLGIFAINFLTAIRSQVGRINSVIGRTERVIALAR